MPPLSSRCPICRTINWRKDLTAGRILGLPPIYSVLLCKSCGQRRLEPKLTMDELKALYSDAYFNSAQAIHSPKRVMQAQSDDYIATVAPGRQAEFARTIQRLKHLHPGARTFLDVGAATGDMVKIARDHGLRAEGIEFSHFAVRKAKELHSIDLQQVALEELHKDGYYDLIHLNHVFEHFNDPVAELHHLHRLLKPQGLLYIEIPYQFHFVEKLLFSIQAESSRFTLHSLHHPYFYTPRTIQRLLYDHGFEVISQSVFDPKRYVSSTLQKKIKETIWLILSLMSIGNYIDIVARRRR